MNRTVFIGSNLFYSQEFVDDMKNDYKEEIERLKIIEEKYKDSQLYIKDFKDEIERLNNIINEIKAYIEKAKFEFESSCIDYGVIYDIIQILNKGE